MLLATQLNGQIQLSLASLMGLVTAFRWWKDWLGEACCWPRWLQSFCQPLEGIMVWGGLQLPGIPSLAWLGLLGAHQC